MTITVEAEAGEIRITFADGHERTLAPHEAAQLAQLIMRAVAPQLHDQRTTPAGWAMRGDGEAALSDLQATEARVIAQDGRLWCALRLDLTPPAAVQVRVRPSAALQLAADLADALEQIERLAGHGRPLM